MEKLLLGQIIKNEVEKIQKQFRGLINSIENDVFVRYEYKTNNGKIQDEIIINVTTFCEDDDINNIFEFETNSLSMIYIEEITKIINEIIKCNFDTEEEYKNEFEKIYNNIKGFYILELTKVV